MVLVALAQLGQISGVAVDRVTGVRVLAMGHQRPISRRHELLVVIGDRKMLDDIHFPRRHVGPKGLGVALGDGDIGVGHFGISIR